MKTAKEFINWLVFKNPISFVYYLLLTIFMLSTIHEKQSIVDNNNISTFVGIIIFLIFCIFLFTFLSVIPEYKKRND